MPYRAFEFDLAYPWETGGIHNLVVLGWPGLIIGALIGIAAWRQHRLVASGCGAIVGMCMWIGLHMVPLF